MSTETSRVASPSAPTGAPSAPSPFATPEPWELSAAGYAQEIQPRFAAYARDALALADPPARGRILDVATGPGTLALLAAENGLQVTAIDFAPAMIQALRTRGRAAHLLDAIDAHVGDGQALPFPDESFDAAFSMFGLMFFPDRPAGFRELRRVLRPGARAVVGSWAPPDAMFTALTNAMRASVPGLPPFLDESALSDPDAFAAEMRAAGFRDVAIRSVEHSIGTATPRQFVSMAARAVPPVVFLRTKLGEARWPAVEAAVLAHVEHELGAGAREVRNRAWLGVGIR